MCKTEKETQMYRTDFWTLWKKARVGCFKRTSKHVYYLGWNRSPAQVGCMRQVLGVGALGRPRGIRWRGRWEGGSGWGRHVNPPLIHVNVWQKQLQYCKVISLQLIKINEKKEVKKKSKPSVEFPNIQYIKVSSHGCCCLVTKLCLTLCDHIDCSLPGSSLWPWDSPGKNTGVGRHFLLQGIFLTRGLEGVSCTAGRSLTIWASRETHS